MNEGHKVFGQIQQALADVAKVEQGVRPEGRRITLVLAPASKQKEKPAAHAPAAPAPPAPAPAAPAPPAAVGQPPSADPAGPTQ
jgi:hypothetical protein